MTKINYMVHPRTVLYLFRNDLRVHDNESLLWAHNTGAHILPVYCFDPDHFKGTWHFNFPKTGVHRTKFLHQSVENLGKNLETAGSCLHIEFTRPVETVSGLVDRLRDSQTPVTDLVYQKEVTYEEVKVEEQLKDICRMNNIKVMEVWGSSFYHKNDLPLKNGINSLPDTYTQFRKDVEGRSKVRPILDMPRTLNPPPPTFIPQKLPPTLSSLGVDEDVIHVVDQRTAFPFQGGETQAIDRLNHYLWGSHAVAKYKETRNGLVGEAYSTKFSPWLSLGCLSPRMVYKMIKKYEEEVVANQSTYWVLFELLWRDYFRFVCMKYGDRVFYLSGIQNKHLPWSQDMVKFKAWKEGETGVPFVDANMRELKSTGWMSNRGRQNVASFLVKDLGLDWRLGAEWFESQLLDHDVCSNYGNWNYAAGIGNDPRENRKFNMIKQGLDYDSDGKFVRLWVPEISNLHGSKVHFPWTLSQSDLERAGVELGVTYPSPMLVAPEWGRHTAGTKGQKGVDFYFKSDSGGRGRGNKNINLGRGGGATYRNTGSEGSNSNQDMGRGENNKNTSNNGKTRTNKPPLRGGRVQY